MLAGFSDTSAFLVRINCMKSLDQVLQVHGITPINTFGQRCQNLILELNIREPILRIYRLHNDFPALLIVTARTRAFIVQLCEYEGFGGLIFGVAPNRRTFPFDQICAVGFQRRHQKQAHRDAENDLVQMDAVASWPR